MSEEQLVHTKTWGIGGGFLDHNVRCWVCEKNKAFYVGNPHWVFAPCMECQERLADANPDAWWPVVQDRRLSWWRRVLRALDAPREFDGRILG